MNHLYNSVTTSLLPMETFCADVGVCHHGVQRACEPVRGGSLQLCPAEHFATAHVTVLRQDHDPNTARAGILPGGILRERLPRVPAEQGERYTNNGIETLVAFVHLIKRCTFSFKF